MSDEQPPRIRRLFDAARELAGPAREAFLCRACGDDARLVRRLLAMLAGADDPRFLALGHRPTPTSNPGESMSRTIVLTGCSSGFGLLAAERFARNGDRVYATMRDPAGRNAEAAGRLTDLAERERLQLHVVDLDVCSDASVEAAAGQILAAGHPPDVLVNNAGQMFTGVTEAFDAAELARQFDVNVVGPHRMHRAFLPAMRARGSGLCIEISSIAGRLAVPFFGVYHASKWALEGYSQALRMELATSGVDVVVVEPGPFTTRLFATTPKPADRDGRAASYPQVVHDTFAGMAAAFEEMFANDPTSTDPELVVDRIVELAAMAPGARPFRSVVGTDFGAEQLNRVALPQHEQMVAQFELGEFVKLAGAPQNA